MPCFILFAILFTTKYLAVVGSQDMKKRDVTSNVCLMSLFFEFKDELIKINKIHEEGMENKKKNVFFSENYEISDTDTATDPNEDCYRIMLSKFQVCKKFIEEEFLKEVSADTTQEVNNKFIKKNILDYRNQTYGVTNKYEHYFMRHYKTLQNDYQDFVINDVPSNFLKTVDIDIIKEKFEKVVDQIQKIVDSYDVCVYYTV